MATKAEIQSDERRVFEKGKGNIPKWMAGVLHRNGPGIVEELALPVLLDELKANEELSISKSRLTRYRLPKVSEKLTSVAASEHPKKLPSAETVFQVPSELNIGLIIQNYI
ncbi:5839_t:CDS:2 [Ambispora gerdemannii]|uniref:5839_t:CDS:1 n=1 Tax=Ambispora gerdemannii TaxID=144530 RepID=A0A9N9CDF6_9GLOM|nr:5839_t:CDS:2 [Ambispora gerdemannii]